MHRLLIEGVPVEVANAEGSRRTLPVRVIDYDEPTNNDWAAVNQFTMVEGRANRRADVVVFVNGLPLASLS